MDIVARRWAEAEFAGAELGDRRRNARVVQLAAACLKRPGGTVTRVVQDAAEREGAFRLLENRAVKAHQLALSSHRATVRRCDELPYVFVAVDQTTLSVTDYQDSKGLGPAGNGLSTKSRGAEVMSALAVTPSGVALGLLAQRWWRRPDGGAPHGKHDPRRVEERESQLWIEALQSSLERLGEVERPTRPWFQLDRGGDFWRVFDLADETGCWLTVRSSHDRRLWDDERGLHKRIAAAPIRAHLKATIPARRNVRQRKRPKRQAFLELRYEPVTLEMLDDEGEYRHVELTVVRVTERSRRRDALQWTLLTTYPIRRVQDATLVVRGYMQRWRIEDFHHTWKSGACDIERSQLRSADNFCRWATIQAAVAARVETLKHVSRTTPDVDATEYLTQTEVDVAIALSGTKKHRPGDSLTLQQAVWLIAQLGGYTGKSSGGPPGTVTIQRGLQEVVAGARAVELLKK